MSTRRQVVMLMRLTAIAPKLRVTARQGNETGPLRIARALHLARKYMERTLTHVSQTAARRRATANTLRLTATMTQPIETNLGSTSGSEPPIEGKLPVTASPPPWIEN